MVFVWSRYRLHVQIPSVYWSGRCSGTWTSPSELWMNWWHHTDTQTFVCTWTISTQVLIYWNIWRHVEYLLVELWGQIGRDFLLNCYQNSLPPMDKGDFRVAQKNDLTYFSVARYKTSPGTVKLFMVQQPQKTVKRKGPDGVCHELVAQRWLLIIQENMRGVDVLWSASWLLHAESQIQEVVEGEYFSTSWVSSVVNSYIVAKRTKIQTLPKNNGQICKTFVEDLAEGLIGDTRAGRATPSCQCRKQKFSHFMR